MTFAGLLGLLFICLKLTNYIAWSWWLVLLPLYGGAALWASIVIFSMFAMTSAALYRKLRWRKR